MPRRTAPVRRLRVIAGAVAGKGATESAFGGNRDADATGHLPPMGTVHAKRADGTWEENAEPDSVWEVKTGPSWTELQAGLAQLKSRTRCQDCNEFGHWAGDDPCRKPSAKTINVKSRNHLHRPRNQQRRSAVTRRAGQNPRR